MCFGQARNIALLFSHPIDWQEDATCLHSLNAKGRIKRWRVNNMSLGQWRGSLPATPATMFPTRSPFSC